MSAIEKSLEGSLLDAVGREYKEIPTRDIYLGPNYRREIDEGKLSELAESIKNYGVLEPLLVRPMRVHDPKGPGSYPYALIAGQRRLKAARMVGLETVPCVVLHLTPGQARQVQILENLQRVDLNPIEEARGLKDLMDEFGWTQEQIAKQLGKSQPWVAQRLGLLGLPKVARDAITRGIWSASHGEAVKPFGKAPAVLEAVVQRSEEKPIPVSQIRAAIEDEIRRKGRRVHVTGYRHDSKEPEFDVGPCQNCDRMVRVNPEWGDGKPKPWCVDADCWEGKQKAAREARIAEAMGAKDEEEGLADLTGLESEEDYHCFWRPSDIPEGCNGCQHLQKAKSKYRDEFEIVCLDYKCWRKRQIAQNKAKRQSWEERVQARLEGIMDKVRRQGFVDSFALLPRRLQVFLASIAFRELRPSGDFNVRAWRKKNLDWDASPGQDYRMRGEEWPSFAEAMEKLPAMTLATKVFEWILLERITQYTPAMQSIEYLLGRGAPESAAKDLLATLVGVAMTFAPDGVSEIGRKTSLRDDLHMDAWEVNAFFAELCSRLDMSIPYTDALKWQTIGDVVDYLEGSASNDETSGEE